VKKIWRVKVWIEFADGWRWSESVLMTEEQSKREMVEHINEGRRAEVFADQDALSEATKKAAEVKRERDAPLKKPASPWA
jgi:hypothetical protein